MIIISSTTNYLQTGKQFKYFNYSKLPVTFNKQNVCHIFNESDFIKALD